LLIGLLPGRGTQEKGNGEVAGSSFIASRKTGIVCQIGPAPSILCDKWSILILCAAFDGLNHFEEFQGALSVARNTLSDRLNGLVRWGLLERNPVPGDARRVRYELTEKGKSLLPMINELAGWVRHWHG
jgi:DNA-binding HxlR family transcriptional regulator